ncbi:MAG: molybdopterin-synthase adenylyltransferase MoeB [Nitrospirota bacterium]
MKFSEEQHLRYLRHLMLPEIGKEGQIKIAKAKVFIVGAGGLGSPVGYYLTAAGVGTIGIIDHDIVDLSNLQRQIAHSVKTLGKPKVESAKNTFESLNPDVHIVAIKERLAKNNIFGFIEDYDIVIDCSDNFATRFLVNDACVLKKKPLVTGAIFQFEGQLTVIVPHEGPCYRCLFEEPPPPGALPAPSEVGLLGVIPGVVGTLQAAEVLKFIVGIGAPLRGELLIYNALKASFRKVKVPKNPRCPICSEHPTITELIDYS